MSCRTSCFFCSLIVIVITMHQNTKGNSLYVTTMPGSKPDSDPDCFKGACKYVTITNY